MNQPTAVKVCCACGTAEFVAKLKPAWSTAIGVITNLYDAYQCDDERDCVRRQAMRMGPQGRGWQGPEIA